MTWNPMHTFPEGGAALVAYKHKAGTIGQEIVDWDNERSQPDLGHAFGCDENDYSFVNEIELLGWHPLPRLPEGKV